MASPVIAFAALGLLAIARLSAIGRARMSWCSGGKSDCCRYGTRAIQFVSMWSVFLLSVVGRFFARPHRRLGQQPAALTLQRLAAGFLPVAGRGAAREGFPGVGPIVERIAVPRRLHVERGQAELLPQAACVLHIFAR